MSICVIQNLQKERFIFTELFFQNKVQFSGGSLQDQSFLIDIKKLVIVTACIPDIHPEPVADRRGNGEHIRNAYGKTDFYNIS